MKEINDQLYGYSYELDQTTEEDRTTCYAVDTGTVFVAYKGVWYEQPGSFWAASISEGEDDLYKTSWEVSKIVPADDLLIINAVDTGKRYVSFNGAWYAQPVQWSAPAAGGGGGSDLPDPTEANDGDVLTVDDGAWVAAAPGGGSDSGVFVVHITNDAPGQYASDKTYTEISAAYESGAECFAVLTGCPVVSLGKVEGYPVLYGQTTQCNSDGQGGGFLHSYDFEFTESGLSVTHIRYTLTEAN